jgi:hypothetical protein
MPWIELALSSSLHEVSKNLLNKAQFRFRCIVLLAVHLMSGMGQAPQHTAPND